jgi:hypothetical protein
MVIASLGSATLAQWQAVGLPVGLVPAVGLAFIPSVSASIGGGAMVAPTASVGSGVRSIEIVGDTNLALAPAPGSVQGFGAQIILQCRNGSGSLVPPADESVISLSFLLSNSSIMIAGE